MAKKRTSRDLLKAARQITSGRLKSKSAPKKTRPKRPKQTPPKKPTRVKRRVVRKEVRNEYEIKIRYRDRKGRLSKFDRRKKLTVEFVAVKLGLVGGSRKRSFAMKPLPARKRKNPVTLNQVRKRVDKAFRKVVRKRGEVRIISTPEEAKRRPLKRKKNVSRETRKKRGKVNIAGGKKKRRR